MSKKNCWEFFDCGRVPGGKNEREMGICPVVGKNELNDINNGINGGRACWAVAGTYCAGKVQGPYAEKLGDCLKCDFHSYVRQQQNGNYTTTKEILTILAQKAPLSGPLLSSSPPLRPAAPLT